MSDDDDDALLFVYGTLRRAAGDPAHALLAAVGSFVGDATVRGRVIAHGGYPALVDGDEVVAGELWCVRDGWDALDAYETLHDAVPQYTRERCAVLQGDRRRTAWVYRARLRP
ncbi:MAG: gamma-glutamylcyclotransferase [Nannocystaceae bacterium]|nr:gamma-glutamylcyclotransferase [Nannocystaceae bacterium]